MKSIDYNIEYINNNSSDSNINSKLLSDITYYYHIKNEISQIDDPFNIIKNNISHINFSNYFSFNINKNLLNLQFNIIPDFFNIIQFYIIDDIDFNNFESIIVNVNNLDLSLNFNTKYNFRFGVSDGIYTFWSPYTLIVTEDQFLNLNLVILNISHNSVEFSWLQLFNSYYLIQVSISPNFSDSIPIPFKSQKTRHIIKNLNPSTTYFIRIGQFINSIYFWSNHISFSTLHKKKFLGLF
jgi:hypothetical protein